MKKFTLVLIALTALVLSSSAYAAASDATVNFIKNAAIGNKFEIDSSKIALKKSSDDDVKAFAYKMVKDHHKAAMNMKVALQNSKASETPVPVELDEQHQAQMNTLQQLSGTDFDKQYIVMQVAAHNDAVNLFQNYATSGDDQNLKLFAGQTLPTLKDHQSHITMLQSQKK